MKNINEMQENFLSMHFLHEGLIQEGLTRTVQNLLPIGRWQKQLFQKKITFSHANNYFNNWTPPGYLPSEISPAWNHRGNCISCIIPSLPGYYRVNYDTRNWNAIIDELHGDSFNAIHELNRAQLLDDSFNLARSGYLDFEIALELLKYLRNETALLPLTAGFKTIDFLLTHLDKEDFFKDLRDIMLDIVETIYVHINNESVQVTAENGDYRVLTKLYVNSFACRVGTKSCLDDASTRFLRADFVTNPVDVDERPYLYCGVVASNSGAHLKMKTKVAGASGEFYRDSQEEFNEIFDAFSECDSDAARVEQLLNDIFIISAETETLNYEHITKENAVQVIENLIKTSSAHRSLLMRFFSDNFVQVDGR